MTLQAVNPATGEALATYEEMTPETPSDSSRASFGR